MPSLFSRETSDAVMAMEAFDPAHDGAVGDTDSRAVTSATTLAFGVDGVKVLY
jgi:hypothetical protein